jgi:hypothetical protein
MPDDFDATLESALDAVTSSLQGSYKKPMRDLLALSMNDIKNSVPNVSYTDYSRLLSVVEHASAANLAQARLKDKITSLGKKAVSIAKLAPSLAALLG